MPEVFHSLLRRQLKRHVGEPASIPDAWRAFVTAVNDAYRQSDRDRAMLERSLELSSEELGQANAEMRQAMKTLQETHHELESRVAERTRELTVANDTLRLAAGEQQRLEAQLRQAQKMEAIGRLAGGVAHDFNNMLMVIFGQVELLTEMAIDEHARESVSEIQHAAESAASLTHQLLAFSRQQTLTPTLVDVNDLVRDTVLLLRRLIGEHIELVTDLELDAGTVRADASQLQQVLLNLGVNARDAMPGGGRLTITTSAGSLDGTAARSDFPIRPGSYVIVTVADTGVGMTSAIKARIFEPFFTTKALNQGTGLGLATAYGIVKQSDGYIDVASEPGRGATFRVLLPRIGVAGAHDAPASPAPEAGAGTILVVEDQDAVRRVVCNRLRRAGYRVREANSGPAALELAATLPHLDLLLTDVVMPHMNGRALALELVRARPSLKVLYMTGYIDDAEVTREIRDRSRPLLQKPFSADTLLNTVRNVLDARASMAP